MQSARTPRQAPRSRTPKALSHRWVIRFSFPGNYFNFSPKQTRFLSSTNLSLWLSSFISNIIRSPWGSFEGWSLRFEVMSYNSNNSRDILINFQWKSSKQCFRLFPQLLLPQAFSSIQFRVNKSEPTPATHCALLFAKREMCHHGSSTKLSK